MFLAAIGDILSEHQALMRVLNHLEEEGIHHIVHTGNVCLKPEGALESVELAIAHDLLSVQGRLDKALVSRKAKSRKLPESATLTECYGRLSSSAIEYLGGLPRKRRFQREGIQWLLCHGAINSPSETLSADTSPFKFLRQREESDADIVITGGAPSFFSLEVEGALFVCPGPLVTAEGGIGYTLIDTETSPWSARLILLPS